MMRKEDCFFLGKIVRKFSFKGEVVAYLDTDNPEIILKSESIFVLLNNTLVPFFIESVTQQKAKHFRLQLEDVHTEEDANLLLGGEIYLPLTLLPKLTGNKFYYHEVIGYKVKDVAVGDLGVIISIKENAAQDLFEIQNNETIVLIPVIDEFIINVDRVQKTIEVKTPEGLVDLYIN